MKFIEALVMAHQEFGRHARWVIRHGYDGPLLEKKQFDYLCYDPPQISKSPGYFAVDSRLEAAIARLAERYPYEVTRGEHWQIAKEQS